MTSDLLSHLWDTNNPIEVKDILHTCGWTTSSYASASSTEADGITVDATAPTALSQLTTTIVPGSTRTKNSDTATVSITASGATATASGSSGSNSDDSSSTDSSGSTATNSAAQASQTDNAAPALAPLGVAGFAVAGAFLMMA